MYKLFVDPYINDEFDFSVIVNDLFDEKNNVFNQNNEAIFFPRFVQFHEHPPTIFF